MNETELMKGERAELATVPDGGSNAIIAVIAKAATDPNVDVDKMERLLAMQERIMGKQAEQLANESLFQFQSQCPQLSRTKTGHNFKYCTYEAMMREVRPIMKDLGFSERFDTTVNDIGVICSVTCTISHRGGYSWTSTFPVSPDNSGSKNQIQGVGSALSYGKRYSFAAAMGIVFKDEDDDGGSPAKEPVPEAATPEWQQGDPAKKTPAKKAPEKKSIDDDLVEDIKIWLDSNSLQLEDFNHAIEIMTKGRCVTWEQLPDAHKAKLTTNEKLDEIKALIEEQKGAAA